MCITCIIHVTAWYTCHVVVEGIYLPPFSFLFCRYCFSSCIHCWITSTLTEIGTNLSYYVMYYVHVWIFYGKILVGLVLLSFLSISKFHFKSRDCEYLFFMNTEIENSSHFIDPWIIWQLSYIHNWQVAQIVGNHNW
jgi:hypothetical protein